MSLSFKTVAKVESPAGNLRLAKENREDGEVSHYKFIGSRALTLDEVVQLHKDLGMPVSPSAEVTLATKRSGYKFKTTWSV